MMTKSGDKSLIVALDIGTSKIVALVGEVAEDNQIEVIGFGVQPSRGLKHGVVVNIETTVQSIQKAVEDAELMAGCEIHSACTGIAGSHIHSLNSYGIVAIRDREVSHLDIERVIDAAKAVAIPADQRVLHILPQEFIVDSQEGVREPIGMSGVRLEAKVHIVTGAVSAAQNISKCVQQCGLKVSDIILEQLASSHAVLSEDEKDLGICMVDIGGGTADIAVFTEGAIRHTAVIPIAGNQVTNDIAVAFRTPTKYAEEIKIKHASLILKESDISNTIEIASVGKRPRKKIQKKILSQVVSARYEELYQLIAMELRRSGFENLIAAGIVLTGGASRISGCAELAEQIFKMPVRVGLPQYVRGLSDVRYDPIYSTGVGLLIHGYQNQVNGRVMPSGLKAVGIWKKMKNWFQDNF